MFSTCCFLLLCLTSHSLFCFCVNILHPILIIHSFIHLFCTSFLFFSIHSFFRFLPSFNHPSLQFNSFFHHAFPHSFFFFLYCHLFMVRRTYQPPSSDFSLTVCGLAVVIFYQFHFINKTTNTIIYNSLSAWIATVLSFCWSWSWINGSSSTG